MLVLVVTTLQLAVMKPDFTSIGNSSSFKTFRKLMQRRSLH